MVLPVQRGHDDVFAGRARVLLRPAAAKLFGLPIALDQPEISSPTC
jgi:hypothetical protein